jgi:hypothetical protein
MKGDQAEGADGDHVAAEGADEEARIADRVGESGG